MLAHKAGRQLPMELRLRTMWKGQQQATRHLKHVRFMIVLCGI